MKNETKLTVETANNAKANVSRSVTRVGYVAMNKGEFDLSNMTFYKRNELEKAKRHWGKKQDIVRVTVKFDVGGK